MGERTVGKAFAVAGATVAAVAATAVASAAPAQAAGGYHHCLSYGNTVSGSTYLASTRTYTVPVSISTNPNIRYAQCYDGRTKIFNGGWISPIGGTVGQDGCAGFTLLANGFLDVSATVPAGQGRDVCSDHSATLQYLDANYQPVGAPTLVRKGAFF